MADDEMAIMEEGGMGEEEDAPEANEDADETSPAEGDEEPAAEEGAEDAEEEVEEGEEGGEVEGGEEEEVLGDGAVGDEELGIRDEDQGRPVTALRLPPPCLTTSSHQILFPVKSQSPLRTHPPHLETPTRAS